MMIGTVKGHSGMQYDNSIRVIKLTTGTTYHDEDEISCRGDRHLVFF